jgi:multidrug efflux pump subunit AcrA (membrane-fusion protein)
MGGGEGRRQDGQPWEGGGGGQGRPGLVFVLDERGVPQPTPVRVGISDGQFVEVRDGLTEGARVITGAEGGRGAGGARPSGSPANPFQPPQFQRRQR